jgi:hypothetical protein
VDAIGGAAKREKPWQDGGSERSGEEGGRRNSEGETRHEGMKPIREIRRTVDSRKHCRRWKQILAMCCG